MARWTTEALFLYRVAGVLLFEATGIRRWLFVFPNLFENWFLFYLVRSRFFPSVRLDSWSRIAIALALLYLPKLGQEYVLHVAEIHPWAWFQGTVLA